MIEVRNATYERTGRDSQRHAIGLVTVILTNNHIREFEDVDENDFENWRVRGFDLDHPPYDMSSAFGYWIRSNSDDDEEDWDEEFDEEDEELEVG